MDAGTRSREDLFGPDKDKEFFFRFDYCQSLEDFSQNPEKSEGGALGESLGNDLLKARLELISEIPKLCSNKVPTYDCRLAKLEGKNAARPSSNKRGFRFWRKVIRSQTSFRELQFVDAEAHPYRSILAIRAKPPESPAGRSSGA